MRHLTLAALAVGLLAGSSALAQNAMTHSSTTHTTTMAAPMASPAAPGNPALSTPHGNKSPVAAAGHNSFTQGQARKRIMKAGYARVTGLAKDADGLWQGMAMKGGKSVKVALDFQGNIVTK